ncbi:MAG TPA: MoaD/ThiS family protein [Methylomirabilota bacterium]|nr:MoaD/ThiS family protein [Methylomirabilota bacterium]
MKVEVQLFATLQPYLPPGAVGDQAFLELPDGSTVAQVQAALHIPDDFSCLTVVNGHDASRDQVLTPGDVVAMFPPLAGGL